MIDFSMLFIIIIVVGLPVGLLRLLFLRKNITKREGISLSKEDAVSQWFFLLAVFFFGVTLVSLNREFGDHVNINLIIFLTCLVGLGVAYYFKAVSVLIFSLIGIVTWWNLQGGAWLVDSNVKEFAIIVGDVILVLIYFVIGNIFDKIPNYKRFSRVNLVLSIISLTVILFYFSTKPGLESLDSTTLGQSIFASWQIAVTLGVGFVILAATLVYAMSKNMLLLAEAGTVLVFVLLFGGLLFLGPQNMHVSRAGYYGPVDWVPSTSSFTSAGTIWAIIFNIIVFLELLGIIFSGYMRKEAWLINLGVIFLFLLIILKYFDWFFTFLDKSLFFIGAGLLLFGLGWFMEKGRRQIMSQIKHE